MTTEIQLRRMERILAISQELISTLSLEQILHNIVHAATELTDCETAAILLLDEHSNDTLRFAAVALYQDRLFDIPVPIAASIAGAAFTRAQPVIVNDAPAMDAAIGTGISKRRSSYNATATKRSVSLECSSNNKIAAVSQSVNSVAA